MLTIVVEIMVNIFFRKRRSSTNYKDHIALEKLTIKLGKTLKKYLSCYVVCAGVCYGNGEQTLHSFFKQAWLGEQSLPIYGTAHNGKSEGSEDAFNNFLQLSLSSMSKILHQLFFMSWIQNQKLVIFLP